MDQSQYLVQALRQMQEPAPQAAPQGLSIQQMQGIKDKRQAFEQANPGQSYMGHGMQQMGQQIQQAPANLMAAPGNAMSGFQRLAQGLR